RVALNHRHRIVEMFDEPEGDYQVEGTRRTELAHVALMEVRLDAPGRQPLARLFQRFRRIVDAAVAKAGPETVHQLDHRARRAANLEDRRAILPWRIQQLLQKVRVLVAQPVPHPGAQPT